MAGIARKELDGEPISSKPDRGAKTCSYLTPGEVAECLRVTRVTVYAWLKMGKLAGERAGKGWRIRPEAVEAFVQQSTQPPVDPATVKRIEARLEVA